MAILLKADGSLGSTLMWWAKMVAPHATMMKNATICVMKIPIPVSTRSYVRSAGWRPLSATLDCWKKAIQGVIVVPTTEMKIRMKAVVGRTVGTKVCRITWPHDGCAMKAEMAYET